MKTTETFYIVSTEDDIEDFNEYAYEIFDTYEEAKRHLEQTKEEIQEYDDYEPEDLETLGVYKFTKTVERVD